MIKPLILSVVSALLSAGALGAQTKPEARFAALLKQNQAIFDDCCPTCQHAISQRIPQ